MGISGHLPLCNRVSSQTFIENAIQDPLYLCSFWRALMHLFVFWTVLKSFFKALLTLPRLADLLILFLPLKSPLSVLGNTFLLCEIVTDDKDLLTGILGTVEIFGASVVFTFLKLKNFAIF